MSAALDRLKQQNAQSGSPQQLGSPDTMETLTSILAAVEAQNARIDRLSEQQRKLAGFVKVMDEELAKRIDRVSTSQSSAGTSPQIASVESRLSEIESTLSEFVQSLDGKRLSAASQSLVAAAQKNHAATASAIERLQAQAEESQKLVSRVGGAVQRIEKRAVESIGKAADAVAERVGTAITAHETAESDRAERLHASNDRLEARKLWSEAAAMCLLFVPVAMIVAGVWVSIAGLITGAQWALDVDSSVWLGTGRWLTVGVGLAVVSYGLFVGTRWVVSLIGTWKDRGMPQWPSWRKK